MFRSNLSFILYHWFTSKKNIYFNDVSFWWCAAEFNLFISIDSNVYKRHISMSYITLWFPENHIHRPRRQTHTSINMPVLKVTLKVTFSPCPIFEYVIHVWVCVILRWVQHLIFFPGRRKSFLAWLRMPPMMNDKWQQ